MAAPIVKGASTRRLLIVKAGADAAAPVVKQGLSKTCRGGGQRIVGGRAGSVDRGADRQLAKAGQVAGQVGDVAGYVGRGALKAGKGVVDAAVPYVEPSARLVGRAANDLLDKQSLSEGTRAALAERGTRCEQAAARGVGSLLRGAASLLDSGGDVAPPAPRSGAANVADAFGPRWAAPSRPMPPGSRCLPSRWRRCANCSRLWRSRAAGALARFACGRRRVLRVPRDQVVLGRDPLP